MSARKLEIPTEFWRNLHRGGQRQWKKWVETLERKRYKLCLPFLIKGNVRSLANKAVSTCQGSERIPGVQSDVLYGDMAALRQT